jgi:hypothetical protein
MMMTMKNTIEKMKSSPIGRCKKNWTSKFKVHYFQFYNVFILFAMLSSKKNKNHDTIQGLWIWSLQL